MSHSTNLFAEPFKSGDVVPGSFVMMNADVSICSFCMTESCSYDEDDFRAMMSMYSSSFKTCTIARFYLEC